MSAPRERPAALLVAALWLAVLAGAMTTAGARAESLDDRVYAIARLLMCPVCTAQTVAESDSTVAQQMRAIIREKLIAGETQDQILRYFVAQFGEGVLAEPPRRGVSLLLYVAPAAALATGLAIAAASIRRWTRGASPPRGLPAETGDGDEAAPAEEPLPDPAELDRLARDLGARER